MMCFDCPIIESYARDYEGCEHDVVSLDHQGVKKVLLLVGHIARVVEGGKRNELKVPSVVRCL